MPSRETCSVCGEPGFSLAPFWEDWRCREHTYQGHIPLYSGGEIIGELHMDGKVVLYPEWPMHPGDVVTGSNGDIEIAISIRSNLPEESHA
jgi:hypothetical protein